MCSRVSDTDICSVAEYEVLKHLKILNVRFAPVGNRLISPTNKSSALQEIYFQCFATSYHLDKSKRKLDIHRGSPREAHSYLISSGLYTSLPRMFKACGNVAFGTSLTDLVNDAGIAMLRNVSTDVVQQERPKSFLFKDPYEECKCGYYKAFWENKSIAKNPKQDYDPSDSDDNVVKTLKCEIRKQSGLLESMLNKHKAPVLYFPVYNERDNLRKKLCIVCVFHEEQPVPPSCNFRLKRLCLRGYVDITDTALMLLREHDLKILDVSYTNVTAEGVKDFMLSHPSCRVVHESACTCGPRMHF